MLEVIHCEYVDEPYITWNYIFVAEVYAYLHSARRRELQNLIEGTKIAKKNTLCWFKVHSMSSNLSPIERACAASYSKLGRILQGFGATVAYWSKIASGTYSSLI